MAVMVLFMTFAAAVKAQDLEQYENKVTKFQLDNGLKFLVIERHVAPVASFVSFVNVGAVNEPVGHTGEAHIFEHEAFKGTHYVGTKNWSKEKEALQAMDEAYQSWLKEKYKPDTDSTALKKRWDTFKKRQEEAGQYVVNNEFSQIVDRNGGTGMNAFTSYDETAFFYSLPSNRVELWFSLESDRFENPVFREFYKEKDVVREERRMRVESSPIGRLVEEFMAVAYTAHPYGRPVIGWNSDIIATTIKDAKSFYNKYYTPSNITIAVAGDVDPDHIKQLAKTYFGDMEKKPEPEPVYTKEPEQRGERRFVINSQSQPILLQGYHTVNNKNPDYEAIQLLSSIISQGRTSLLYRKLVEEQQLALNVNTITSYPGSKYESMFLTLAVPNRGVSPDSLEKAINAQIDSVKNGAITQEALDRARTNARANLIRGLDDNSNLALTFAQAEAQQGDWRSVFTRLDKYDKVTLDDLQRVANKYLTKDNRTVGMIKNQETKKEVANADAQ